jgi:hypothetical protein
MIMALSKRALIKINFKIIHDVRKGRWKIYYICNTWVIGAQISLSIPFDVLEETCLMVHMLYDKE